MDVIETLIVDDNISHRWQVRELLNKEPDIDVVGEAGNGQEAIRKVRQLGPDVVLMDIRMPGMSGIDATARLKCSMPDVEIVVVTSFDRRDFRERAAASGAGGYVVKSSMVNTLIPTIRRVHWGRRQRSTVRT
jgi:two-component system response regulator DesR